jgi:hypothetical protein
MCAAVSAAAESAAAAAVSTAAVSTAAVSLLAAGAFFLSLQDAKDTAAIATKAKTNFFIFFAF